MLNIKFQNDTNQLLKKKQKNDYLYFIIVI
jgi:hypothetical protein